MKQRNTLGNTHKIEKHKENLSTNLSSAIGNNEVVYQLLNSCCSSAIGSVSIRDEVSLLYDMGMMKESGLHMNMCSELKLCTKPRTVVLLVTLNPYLNLPIFPNRQIYRH